MFSSSFSASSKLMAAMSACDGTMGSGIYFQISEQVYGDDSFGDKHRRAVLQCETEMRTHLLQDCRALSKVLTGIVDIMTPSAASVLTSFDDEDEPVFPPVFTDDAMPGLRTKDRHIDDRHRIGGDDFQGFAGPHADQQLARLQHRQRTGKPRCVEAAHQASRVCFFAGMT